ncbi:MAG: hypothetical protein NVS9B10_09780 [Nevskia sp.]
MNPFRSLFTRQALYRRSFPAMGTTVTVTVAATRRDARGVEAAIAEVRDEMLAFGREAWSWGGGALADCNRRLQAGETVPIPPRLRPLFRRAWELRLKTAGRFEPRIAQLVRLWGFDDIARLRKTPPEPAEIRRLLQAIRQAPDYDGGDHYGPAPDVAWDFGAFGKGHIVDRALDRLAAGGFTQATVDAGGHVGARGRRHGVAWRIGIRDPLAAQDASGLRHATPWRRRRVGGHAWRRPARVRACGTPLFAPARSRHGLAGAGPARADRRARRRRPCRCRGCGAVRRRRRRLAGACA